jgi:hypothetical protein
VAGFIVPAMTIAISPAEASVERVLGSTLGAVELFCVFLGG